jgi:hypothetical protein
MMSYWDHDVNVRENSFVFLVNGLSDCPVRTMPLESNPAEWVLPSVRKERRPPTRKKNKQNKGLLRGSEWKVAKLQVS